MGNPGQRRSRVRPEPYGVSTYVEKGLLKKRWANKSFAHLSYDGSTCPHARLLDHNYSSPAVSAIFCIGVFFERFCLGLELIKSFDQFFIVGLFLTKSRNKGF